MPEILQHLSVAVASLAVTFLVFLVFRELITWYWKINKRQQLQEQILEQLKLQNTLSKDTSALMRQILTARKPAPVSNKPPEVRQAASA